MKINTGNFDQLIVENKATALLVFTADWCRPCLLQKKVIDKLIADYADKASIAIIDVDEDEKLADRFNVRTLPTSVLFGAGEVIEILAGFQAEDFLNSYLQHILSNLPKDSDDGSK